MKSNNNDDDDLLRSPYEPILKLANNQTNKPTEQQPKEEIYQTLNFTQNAYKAPIRSTNPFDENVRQSSPPTSVIQQLPQEKPIVSEQQTKPNQENTEEYYGKYSRTFFVFFLNLFIINS